MKKVLLIIAHRGFQHTEYRVPRQMLEDAGMQVITASDNSGEARATDGSIQMVDIVLEDVNPATYDGLFLIGGPGALEHLDNQETNRIFNEAVVLDVVIGAMCISPRILAKANVITGKRATGWNGDGQLEQLFDQNNVEYVNEPVVIDKKVITACGPEAAEEFGKAMVNVFTSQNIQ